MKGSILDDNLEGQVWESRLFAILLPLSSKKGPNRKRGESFGSCSAWEGGKWLTLGKEGFAWGPGVGGNYTD